MAHVLYVRLFSQLSLKGANEKFKKSVTMDYDERCVLTVPAIRDQNFK